MKERIIGEIYEASHQSEHWNTVLRLLIEDTGSNSAFIVIKNKHLHHTNSLYTHGLPDNFAQQFQQLNNPESSIDTLFNREFMTTYGLDTYTAHNLLENEETRACFGIFRTTEQGPFDPGTLKLIDYFSPHITRSIRIYLEYIKQYSRKLAAQSGLDNLSMGILLYDEFSQLLYMNSAARVLIDNHPAISLVNGKLTAYDRQENQELNKAIENAIGNTSSHSGHRIMGIHHIDNQHPLAASVVSVFEPGDTLNALIGKARAIVYLTDVQQPLPISGDALKCIYGLTNCEAMLAIELSNGFSLEQVAEMQNVSIYTIRSHLKSIFRKLDISRQCDVVRIVMSLPAIRNNFS